MDTKKKQESNTEDQGISAFDLFMASIITAASGVLIVIWFVQEVSK